MTVASYIMQISNTSGTGTYDLETDVIGKFGSFVAGLTEEHGTGPWADVGYTAYTLDADGEYEDVEVGRGTVTDATPDTLTRSDANISFSTNSNNRVDWAVGKTIYIKCTINVWDIENG